MHMYEGVWVLCAVKLDDKASGVNLRGRFSFPIELELTKLPLKLAIDDSTRMFSPSSQKSLGEHLPTIMLITDEFVGNFGKDSEPLEFIPSLSPASLRKRWYNYSEVRVADKLNWSDCRILEKRVLPQSQSRWK